MKQPVYLRLSPENFERVDGLLQQSPADPDARRRFESTMCRILTIQDFWVLVAAARNQRPLKVIIE